MEGTEEEKYTYPNFFPVLHVFNLTSMAVVNFAYTVKRILTNLFTVMPIFSIFLNTHYIQPIFKQKWTPLLFEVEIPMYGFWNPIRKCVSSPLVLNKLNNIILVRIARIKKWEIPVKNEISDYEY